MLDTNLSFEKSMHDPYKNGFAPIGLPNANMQDIRALETESYGLWQRTLAHSVEFSGIAVHSGLPAQLVVRPAPANNGIVFVTSSGVRIPAHIDYLHPLSGELSTVIGANGAQVGTIEHLMAAFALCGISNADVEMKTPELPIMDGSAKAFVQKFATLGLVQQESKRKFLCVDSTHRYVDENGGWVQFDPLCNQQAATLDVHVDYTDMISQIGVQSFCCIMTPQILRQELSDSRTFGREDLRSHYAKENKGLGASTENTVLYTQSGLLNPQGTRYVDEAVRHKSLDLIGDLFLAGWPLLGHVSASKPGHRLNALALTTLMKSQKCRVTTL